MLSGTFNSIYANKKLNVLPRAIFRFGSSLSALILLKEQLESEIINLKLVYDHSLNGRNFLFYFWLEIAYEVIFDTQNKNNQYASCLSRHTGTSRSSRIL